MNLSIQAKLAFIAVSAVIGCAGGYYASGHRTKKRESERLKSQLAAVQPPVVHTTIVK